MGSSQRNKGAAGERELAKVLNRYGFDVHRGHVFYHEPDLIGIPGIHIECKRVEKLDIKKAMAQAIEEAAKKDGGKPCVFHRVNRGEWKVTMRVGDYIEIFNTACPISNYWLLDNGLVTMLLDEWVAFYRILYNLPIVGEDT